MGGGDLDENKASGWSRHSYHSRKCRGSVVACTGSMHRREVILRDSLEKLKDLERAPGKTFFRIQ